MSRLLWLLVEWVDERNVFPSYGIVNVDSVIGNGSDTDLHPGKMVVIQAKQRGSAKRAQILRISDEKSHVKEHKLLLERQDHQVKNVLSLCMRTIKEMKSDPIYFGSMGTSNPISIGNGSSSSMTQVVANNDSSESSDSESESDEEPIEKSRHKERKSTSQHKKQDKIKERELVEKGYKFTLQSQPTKASRKSHSNQDLLLAPLVTSSPVPTNVRGNVKEPEPPKKVYYYTQGTQTDEVDPQEGQMQEKLEKMEVILTHLYTSFLTLVDRLNIFPVNTREMNGNGVGYETEEVRVPIIGTVEVYNEEHAHNDNQDEDVGRKPNGKTLHVRRVSAHTTNEVVEPTAPADSDSTDMVAIGAGSAKVPARLMNEINWDSYTSATRQLLQAIFPRKVLATHSLTGKRSPAFTSREPKKCLDPKIISDIVDTVSQRCGVPKNLVRSSITTKCTDEAKLFRNRQHGRINQVANQENVAPMPISPLSSYESSSPAREVKPF